LALAYPLREGDALGASLRHWACCFIFQKVSQFERVFNRAHEGHGLAAFGVHLDPHKLTAVGGGRCRLVPPSSSNLFDLGTLGSVRGCRVNAMQESKRVGKLSVLGLASSAYGSAPPDLSKMKRRIDADSQGAENQCEETRLEIDRHRPDVE
jgi:hypothetical protein